MFFFRQNITNMNFQSVMENKRILLAEASDGETKKLVDNSPQGNTKKSTKYAQNHIHFNHFNPILYTKYQRAFPLRNYSELLHSPGTREHILISFRRREKSKFFCEDCKLTAPVGFFSEALGLVFVYTDSPLGLLRMHNHNFVFAFFA